MTKKELFKKLDELGVKEQFIKNLARTCNNDKHAVASYYKQVLEFDFENCVSAAFIWANSPQGTTFWSDISLTI